MKQPAKIYDWVKSLSMKERDQLAEEVGRSARYLTTLATAKTNISIELASAMLESATNHSSPLSKRVLKKDFEEYINYKVHC